MSHHVLKHGAILVLFNKNLTSGENIFTLVNQFLKCNKKIFIFLIKYFKTFEKKCEKINILWLMEKKTKRNQMIVLLKINQLTMNQKDSGKNLRSTRVKNTVTFRSHLRSHCNRKQNCRAKSRRLIPNFSHVNQPPTFQNISGLQSPVKLG